MKILHTVESYLPARHGMSEVVRQISERLAARGHQVTVATSQHPQRRESRIAGVNVRSFDVHGKSATGVSGDVAGYQDFLLNFNPDIIVNFAAQQWATDLAFPILDRLKARKIFVPTGFSALGDSRYQAYFSSMPEWLRGYDACVFLSDDYRDIDFARQAGIQAIAIIPNGADPEEFQSDQHTDLCKKLGVSSDHQLILHVAGYLAAAKGQLEAVKIFSASTLKNATLLLVSPGFAQAPRTLPAFRQPLKALSLWAIAKKLRDISFLLQFRFWRGLNRNRNTSFHRQILAVSLTREEVIAAFLDADLFLFPSWIECSPLVLFEAAAARTPFLVTDVGNAAEIIRWTGGGRLLPGKRINDRQCRVQADVQAGARELDALMADRDRRLHMAASAHQALNQHFSWSCITDQYERLYKTLLDGSSIQGLFPAPPAITP